MVTSGQKDIKSIEVTIMSDYNHNEIEKYPLKINQYIWMRFDPPSQIALYFVQRKEILLIDYSAVLRINEIIADIKQQDKLRDECRKQLNPRFTARNSPQKLHVQWNLLIKQRRCPNCSEDDIYHILDLSLNKITFGCANCNWEKEFNYSEFNE